MQYLLFVNIGYSASFNTFLKDLEISFKYSVLDVDISITTICFQTSKQKAQRTAQTDCLSYITVS